MLVVDDDLALQHLICRFLDYNDFITETASDGKTARQVLHIFKPDLVLLDVNLPDDTGFNLCQEITRTGTLVVMLSSMTDSLCILKAFNQGADDYITKPFDLEILKARIDAIFRRSNYQRIREKNSNILIFDNLKIDFARREVLLKNQPISFTALEFDLLYFLASNPNKVWDRGELISAIWNKNDYDGDDRKVDIHIGRIRKKINDRSGDCIKTIWGRGYMFELSDSDAVKLAD